VRYPWLLQTLGWSLLAVLDFTLNRASSDALSLGWPLYAALLLGGLGCAISSALFALYQRVTPTVPVAVGGALVGTAAWYLVTYAIDHTVGYPWADELAAGLFGRGMLLLFIMLAWHAALLALRGAARAAQAEALAKEAKLAALRYQLNPHFLFNALSSAIALIDEDPARAQRVLELLSSLLRDTLQEDLAAETSLERELAVIDRYLEIQRVRFEDKLAIATEVPAGARRCAVPPLMVHALVENAVKHGLETAVTLPVSIRVAATYDGTALRVEVTNTGTLGSTPGTGVGLRNVRDRLVTLYPDRHSFTLAEADGHVRATLEIQAPRVIG
jgi:hypothetical protein